MGERHSGNSFRANNGWVLLFLSLVKFILSRRVDYLPNCLDHLSGYLGSLFGRLNCLSGCLNMLATCLVGLLSSPNIPSSCLNMTGCLNNMSDFSHCVPVCLSSILKCKLTCPSCINGDPKPLISWQILTRIQRWRSNWKF